MMSGGKLALFCIIWVFAKKKKCVWGGGVGVGVGVCHIRFTNSKDS